MFLKGATLLVVNIMQTTLVTIADYVVDRIISFSTRSYFDKVRVTGITPGHQVSAVKE
jgi:hypothetical protein